MKAFFTIVAVVFCMMGFAQKNTTSSQNTKDNRPQPKYIRAGSEADSSTVVLLNSSKIITLKEMLAMDTHSIKSSKIISDTTSKTKVKRIVLVETY